MDTNEFYNELERDISNSRTEKNLKFLNKKAKKFVDGYLTQPISAAYKKTILAGYRRVNKLIKAQIKRVN